MKRGALLTVMVLLAGFRAAGGAGAESTGPPSDRAVAVTFDDLPQVSVPPTDLEGYRKFTRRLLAAIRKHDVPALGLVTGRQLHPGHLEESLVPLLEMWLDAGLELGNHTWSHRDFPRFIPLEGALTDLAYRLPDTYAGPGGITWIHRWALTRGVAPSFFAGEPGTPEFVKEVAGTH